MPCTGQCFANVDGVGLQRLYPCPNPEPCTLQKCPNHIICKTECEKWALDMNKGICTQCRGTVGVKLFISKSTCHWRPHCFLCLTQEEGVDFVRYKCGHTICAGCLGSGVRPYKLAKVNPKRFGFEEPRTPKGLTSSERKRIRTRALQQWVSVFGLSYQRAMLHARELSAQKTNERRRLVLACQVCKSSLGRKFVAHTPDDLIVLLYNEKFVD